MDTRDVSMVLGGEGDGEAACGRQGSGFVPDVTKRLPAGEVSERTITSGV